MSRKQLERLQFTRRSLVITLALVVTAFATALSVVVYPWDALTVHGASLRHMLIAIVPVALLAVAVVLFLAFVYKETQASETAEEALYGDRLDREEEIDAAAVVDRAMAALAYANEDGGFRCELPTGLPAVWGDARRIEFALTCLMLKGGHALEPDVSVVVRGGKSDEGGLRLEIAHMRSSADQPRGADPGKGAVWYSSEDLKLCWEIMRRYGGKIREKRLGSETCFEIEFPPVAKNG